MIVCIRSISLNPARFVIAVRSTPFRLGLHSLFKRQITDEPSHLSLRSGHAQSFGASYPAQSLQLSPRSAIDAARFPFKSP
jgi:hypothetical protein